MSDLIDIVIKYKLEDMLALLYNLQIFALVGETSQRRVSRYNSEYLYSNQYLLLVSWQKKGNHILIY